MQHRIRFVLPAFALFTLLLTFQAVHASSIQLPRTGQTVCYDAAGDVVSCANTGQDGEKLAGKPWPSPRFIDNSDGTVTDNLTGLIWLKNAACFDTVGGIPKGTDAATSNLSWPDALTWSINLKDGDCGLSDFSFAGDWRLPNITELESLVDAQKFGPALPESHPFDNVQLSYYWSSTTYAAPLLSQYESSWFVDMDDGFVNFWQKSDSCYVWPVRDARVGP